MYRNLLKCAEKKWIVQKCFGVYRKVLEWNVKKSNECKKKYSDVQECTELY